MSLRQLGLELEGVTLAPWRLALVSALQHTEQELLQKLADREREAAAAADDPLERLLQDHGVRGIAWRAAQLPTDQHRDKVAEWLDMLLESVKRPES